MVFPPRRGIPIVAQGGAARLRRSARPWADMLRPLRGPKTAGFFPALPGNVRSPSARWAENRSRRVTVPCHALTYDAPAEASSHGPPPRSPSITADSRARRDSSRRLDSPNPHSGHVRSPPQIPPRAPTAYLTPSKPKKDLGRVRAGGIFQERCQDLDVTHDELTLENRIERVDQDGRVTRVAEQPLERVVHGRRDSQGHRRLYSRNTPVSVP